MHNIPSSSHLLNPSLIDDLFHSLTSILVSISTHIPSKTFQPHRSPGWNYTLKCASRKCKLRFREWVVASRPRNIFHPVCKAYKDAKKHFRSCLRLRRKSRAENFFTSLDAQMSYPRRFFQSIRRHTSSNSGSLTQRLIYEGKEYTHDSIPEAWASYFESLATPVATPFSEEQLKILAAYHCSQSLPADEPDLVSEEEVVAIIHSLPLWKAAGPDHITNEHLKFGGSGLPMVLSALFNATFLSGHIPASFRHGLIIPIPKGNNKDLSIPTNYRGITLSSVIGKIFEKVLLHHLTEQQSQLNPLQGGFRSGFSCVHSAFILQESITSIREQKQKAFVAFLDVKRAFDTVWHAGLMYKLAEFQCLLYIWHLLDKWYSQSTSAVLWNSCISRSFRIQQGVRQGAILSPLLYSIFVNSLLDQLTDSGRGAHIGNIYCGALMYADDLALISSSEADLHHMLSMLSDYALMWRYHFNAAKSAVLVFG